MPTFNFATMFREALPKLAESIKAPGIPELINRGTAEAPAVALKAEAAGPPVRKFAPSVSSQALDPQYHIDPEIENRVSQTYSNTKTLEDRVQQFKTLVGSIFDPTPNMPKDIKQMFLDARTAFRGSHEYAARDLVEQLGSLADDPKSAFKTTMMLRQMKIADTVRHMESKNLDSYGGLSYAKWKDANNKLLAWVRDNPDVGEAHGNIRNGLDDLFDDMVNRGWIIPDRYLEAYTPMKKINTIFNALGDMSGSGGDALKSRVLSSMKSRGNFDDLAIDESNMLHILHEARAEYYRKVAEHDMFLKIINDPTLNFTSRYSRGESLPKDLAVYNPGAGMIGSTHVSREGQAFGDALRELAPDADVRAGGWVLPKQLVDELNNFHPMAHHPLEKFITEKGRFSAKMLTVYNPSNTGVNWISDAFLAMLGMPGEKANPMGFLRFYHAGGQAAEAFSRGEKFFMKINGQEVDVTKLIADAGVSESTLLQDLSGRGVSPELSKFMPSEEIKTPNPLQQVGDTLAGWRQRVELTPRIAAGLAALEKTGDIKEFGRVARNITLNYGAGAPKLSKVPIMRFMSPFITFQGLATERIFKLATTSGSRGRTLAALAAVPTSIYLWNTHNDEYKAVYNSIMSGNKSTLPLILGDGETPLRDERGNPIVLQAKWFVPEDVMKMVGLGNLPSRVARVASGRDTLGDFATDAVQSGAETVKSSMVIPNLAGELLTGKSQLTGQPFKGWDDWAMRLAPALRLPFNMAKEAENARITGVHDPLIVARTVGEAFGAKGVPTDTKVGHSFDADLREAIAEKNKAQRDLANAAAGKGHVDKVRAARRLKDAINKLRRIVEVIKREKGEREAARIFDESTRVGEWNPEDRSAFMDQQSEDMGNISREELNM